MDRQRTVNLARARWSGRQPRATGPSSATGPHRRRCYPRPTTMNVSIQTLGCKVNFAEMAELGDRLARVGFSVSESAGNQDLGVIDSCTVTAQADRKLRTLVHGLRRRHPQAHLILTGC